MNMDDTTLEKMAEALIRHTQGCGIALGTMRAMDTLRQVRDAAAKDTERLDWLDWTKNNANCYRIGDECVWWVNGDMSQDMHLKIRAAIDAAMSAGKGGRE